MNILVIGTGYVGTTTALVFAEMGWAVTGLDTDLSKIERLSRGSLHFYEPGLEELLQKQLLMGRIRFTAEKEMAIRDHDVIFICVGTPSREDGSADLRYVQQVAEDIGRYMNSYKLVVNKSTVPVGTQEKVAAWIRGSQWEPVPYDVASNPEFLREGKALEDAMHPDRVVIGTDSAKAAHLLKTLYQSMPCPVVQTTPRAAETIKYAANAFLATKISYMNELARLCDRIGVNVKEVAHGIGLDPRIGESFLQAGIGYGGSCFPKDVAALLRTAEEHGTELTLLEKVVRVNRSQYEYFLEKARRRLGSFAGRSIAVLGLAFKPDTDDIREAPALPIIRCLLQEQAQVTLYDPVAKLPPDLVHAALTVAPTPEDALRDADAVLLCTEWPVFARLDWERAKSAMKQPLVFDGRNLLEAAAMRDMGFEYEGIGCR